MATDAASGWVLDEIKSGNPIPKPSHIHNIHLDKGGFTNLLSLDMNAYTKKYGKLLP